MRVPVNTPCTDRRSPQSTDIGNTGCYTSALDPMDILEATKIASREYQHFRRHFRSNDCGPSSADGSLDEGSPERSTGIAAKISICHVPNYDRRPDGQVILIPIITLCIFFQGYTR